MIVQKKLRTRTASGLLIFNLMVGVLSFPAWGQSKTVLPQRVERYEGGAGDN
jgi:hypothetical protein